jgi:hypothetical protein
MLIGRYLFTQELAVLVRLQSSLRVPTVRRSPAVSLDKKKIVESFRGSPDRLSFFFGGSVRGGNDGR